LFNKAERLISFRNLRPKKKEGFLKIISIFSFLGIMLGVAILIIVMSVMNGFRTDLTNKILGFNSHITIQSFGSDIDNDFKKTLSIIFKDFRIERNYNGEGIVISKNQTKGVVIKGVDKNLFLKKNLIEGNLDAFTSGTVILGKELSLNLNLSIGDRVSLMSSTFIGTPFGQIPKQESYLVSGIFNSGFYEFDQNVIFLNINDALSFFGKNKSETIL
jgi:lipoprotein-releasing system permease protein